VRLTEEMCLTFPYNVSWKHFPYFKNLLLYARDACTTH